MQWISLLFAMLPLLHKHLIYGDAVTFVVSLKLKSNLSFSFGFCSRHLLSRIILPSQNPSVSSQTISIDQ